MFPLGATQCFHLIGVMTTTVPFGTPYAFESKDKGESCCTEHGDPAYQGKIAPLLHNGGSNCMPGT